MPLEIKVRAIPDVSQVESALRELEKTASIKIPISSQPESTSAYSNTRSNTANITRELNNQVTAYRKLNTLARQYDTMQAKTSAGFASENLDVLGDFINKYRNSDGTFKAITGDSKAFNEELQEMSVYAMEADNQFTKWKQTVSDWDAAFASSAKSTADQTRAEQQQLSQRSKVYNQLATAVNRYNNALQLEETGFRSNTLDSIREEMSRYRTASGGVVDINSLDQNAFDELSKNIDDYSRRLRQVNVEASDFTRNRSVERSINSEATALKNLSRQMSDYMNANRNLINNRSGYSSLQELFNNVNTGQIDSSNARKQFSAIRAEMQALGLESETLGQRISKLFGDHFNTAIALAGINALQLGLQQLVVSVQEIDKEVTELRKVTNLSGSDIDAFLTEASGRAANLGASLSDIIAATSDAAKLGYDIEDASTLGDVATLYKNVADDISNIEDASSALFGTAAGFGVEAQDMLKIVDAFNEVANRTNVDTGDLGEAMRRSSAALAEANNSMEESIGLVVAANSVIRDADVVGTALKTLSMNLRSAETAKDDIEAMGVSTEGMASSTAKLRESLLQLTGVDIMLDEDTLKSTYQILKEISQVWGSITDIDQAAALELMAGKRQGNVLAAILNNFELAEEASEIAANSAGSAWRENEVYLDSINGKIGQFQASFQGLSTSILDSDVAKWFIDLGTAITQAMQKLSEFSGGPGWLLGGALGAFASYRDAGIWSVVDNPDRFSGKQITRAFGNGGPSDTELSALKEYNDIILKISGHVPGATEALDKFNAAQANTRLGDYIGTLNGGIGTVTDFASSLTKVSTASRVAAVGMNLLAAAGNTLVGIGIGIAINGIINGITWLATSSQRAAEEAQKVTQEYNDQIVSLQDYRSRVESLNAQLSSGNLSFEENKAVRMELLSIQQEMISQFGSEADSISLVTSAIQGQSSAWKELEAQEYQNWIYDVQDTGQLRKAEDYMENLQQVFFPTGGADEYYEEFEDRSLELAQFAEEVNRELAREFPNDISWDGIAFSINALPEELTDPNGIVNDIKNARREIVDELASDWGFSTEEIDAVNTVFERGISTDTAALEEEMATHSELYDTYLEGLVKYSDEFSKVYDELSEAATEYDNAIASGDAELVNQAGDRLQTALDAAMERVGQYNGSPTLKENLKDYFKDAFPTAEELDIWRSFDKFLDLENIDSFVKTIDEAYNGLKDVSQIDLYEALFADAEDGKIGNAEDDISQLLIRLAEAAEYFGIISDASDTAQLSAFIDKLVELGYVSGVTENTIQQLSTEFNTVAEAAQSAIDEATLLTEALNSQTTGQGVTLENFEALIAANENYADALEYSNGVMQINADRAREIANQDISEQIAKATTEMKLQAQELRNTESSLENYRERLAKLQQQQELGFVVNQDTIDALKSSIASYEESSATIQENIAKYSVLISNLREATSAYQLWQDAQNAPESGDMYDDTLSALQQINEGLESGKVGTQKFEASVEFLIPDDVSRDNAEAIEDYKENVLDRYITFDEESGELIADGVANFTNDALNKGLASVDENGDWQVNAGVVMQDFVDKMHLTPEMVRAIFGELEEYGFEFAWDDEFRESMELTEEEVTQYKDKINQTLSEIGTDPIDIQANVSEITQAEADLYDLENYDVPGLIELPINVKANLQIQSDIEEKQSEIETLKAGLLNEDGTINLEVQAEISQAETDLAILQARLAALEQPTQVEIELATATIDEQIANLQLQLEGLDPKSETFELDTQNIQGQIDALEQTKIDIQSGLTTTEFDENASAVESKIDELSEKEATPRVRLVGHTTAIANINSVAAAISGLPRERTISIKTRYDPSGAIAAGLSSVVSAGGSAGAFGTATTGYAYANGEWGISHAQKALVGELGRELVVDPYSGKWKTVGDFGAEIVDLPKGAIVFNHLQTEEILKKGYVHGRGTALASGNAFVTGGGNLGNIQVGQGITDWDTGYIPGANAATNATNNYTNAVKDAASATSDASEEVEEYISDLWELYEVETKLADIQADSDILETQLDMADSANKAIGIQEKLLDQYEAEQEALHNLVEARRELIQEDIATLRDQGFIINYDPEQNNLFIENTEHVNDLMGATQEETNDLRKEMEELINSIIDMNDANQESGKSWWDLAQNIQQVKEELAENATSIFDDFIEYMDAFELWADSGINRVAALSQKQAELNRLYEEGYLTIQAYREQSFDLQQEIYEEQRDSITEIIELTEEMIKQEVEDQIDALEKQIEAYRELIDLRKEALEENKRENDHQDEINEKLEEMAKLRQQIDRLNLAAQSGDRAAAAEKAALDEQYAELQKELVDMQADYSYDTQQDAIDKEMEAFEEQKNEEIKKLEESIDTEVKLYNLAIARINEGWDKLYQDLISYNSKYGDAIDGEDSLKTAWENATEAVKDYAYNVEAALQGIKTEGSFGNIQTNRVNELINQMKANGQGWANATTQAEKDRYEAANEALAKQLSVELGRPVVKGYDGEWYLDKVGGQKLYDVYPGGTTSRPSTEDDANKENATEAKVRELVRNMRANGSKYANATSDAEREVYAAANRQIAQQVSSLIGQPVVIGDDGVWYIGAVGRRKLYDVYHKGGIVGNAGTLKDNEMFTVLEKGEFVLSDSQKKTLFDLIGVAKNLNDIPTNKLVASRGIETRDFGGDSFQADFDIDFNVSGELDTNSARKFADMFADYAISKMQKGFSKSGIFNGRAAFGKA